MIDLIKIDNPDVMKVKNLGADVCMYPGETTTQPTTTGTVKRFLLNHLIESPLHLYDHKTICLSQLRI